MENKVTQTGKATIAKVSDIDGLRSLFISQLKTSLWIAKRLIKAHSKMARNASSPNLTSLLQKHIVATEAQLGRLENILGTIGQSPRGKRSEGLEALIQENLNLLAHTKKGPVRDAGIIAASQKVVHYLIAGYCTLINFADTLGENKIISVLKQTLTEEQEEEELLYKAARNTINYDALPEDEVRRRASHYYRNK